MVEIVVKLRVLTTQSISINNRQYNIYITHITHITRVCYYHFKSN